MTTQKTKVRFAPSPTGRIHVGNVRTAILTWLYARATGGTFLLRLDDTDVERSKEEHAQALMADLRWLGVEWDEFARQRDRMDRYAQAIERLKADGRLYACYETPEELSLKRKTLLQRGLPPIYDRAALALTDAQKSAYEKQGRRPHWRFKLEHKTIAWNDLIRGPVAFEGKDMSDPVLIREDGSPLYHICSVIDDLDYGITHIIRGEDHVSNTAAHIQMFEALGGDIPVCAHLPLISDAEGGKLSKRLGSLSVGELRDDEGLQPMAIINLMARLGTSLPIEAYTHPAPLIESFDFGTFSRSTPKFDPEELVRLNAKILHQTDYSEILPALKDLGLEDVSEEFWLAVRPNLSRLREIRDWWSVAKGPVTPEIAGEDTAFIAAAHDCLPPAPWTEETWGTWIAEVKNRTDRKGKTLFMPLRKALTGMEHGPELNVLLPLIGPDKVSERLQAK